MNVFLLAKFDELRRGIIGVELDLINGWDSLARMLGEKVLEVFDAEVGDSDIADFVFGELLHLLPSLDKIPVRQMLRFVFGISRTGPVLSNTSVLTFFILPPGD